MRPDQVKQQVDNKFSSILEEVGGFFAFSDRQFKEKAKEGVKYCNAQAGLILPKENVDLFLERLDEIDKLRKSLYAQVDRKRLIEYELANYESYYTGDIHQALEALRSSLEDVTEEEVYKIYRENLKDNNGD